MAGCVWFAAVFLSFYVITLNHWNHISRDGCRYQLSLAEKPISRSWSSFLGKKEKFAGVDTALAIWSSRFCMKTMTLSSLKQRMFNDLLRRKFTKSRFRYYPNDEASFNVELNPGPPAEGQGYVQSYTNSSLFRIPTHITQRPENHMQFSHPCCFKYANSTNLTTIPQSLCLLPPVCSISKNLHFCLLNTRSVRNKVMVVKDFSVDNDIDNYTCDD